MCNRRADEAENRYLNSPTHRATKQMECPSPAAASGRTRPIDNVFPATYRRQKRYLRPLPPGLGKQFVQSIHYAIPILAQGFHEFAKLSVGNRHDLQGTSFTGLPVASSNSAMRWRASSTSKC